MAENQSQKRTIAIKMITNAKTTNGKDGFLELKAGKRYNADPKLAKDLVEKGLATRIAETIKEDEKEG